MDVNIPPLGCCPAVGNTTSGTIFPFEFECGLESNTGLMVMDEFQYHLETIWTLFATPVLETILLLTFW